MKKDIEVYRKFSLFEVRYDSNSPYNVCTRVLLRFSRNYWKRLINFLIRPFTLDLLDDIEYKIKIEVSEPKITYPNIDGEDLYSFRKNQFEIIKSWVNTSEEFNEILRREKIKFKYRDLYGKR